MTPQSERRFWGSGLLQVSVEKHPEAQGQRKLKDSHLLHNHLRWPAISTSRPLSGSHIMLVRAFLFPKYISGIRVSCESSGSAGLLPRVGVNRSLGTEERPEETVL
jgi:hypothetical protein